MQNVLEDKAKSCWQNLEIYLLDNTKCQTQQSFSYVERYTKIILSRKKIISGTVRLWKIQMHLKN